MTTQIKLKQKPEPITKNSEIMYPLPPEFYTCTESMKSLIPIMLNLIDQKITELKKKLYDYLSTTTLSNDHVDDAHEQIKALNRISTEVHDAVTDWEIGCNDKEHIGVYAGSLTECFHILSWKYTYLEAFELDELYRNLPDYVFDESLDRYYSEPNL